MAQHLGASDFMSEQRAFRWFIYGAGAFAVVILVVAVILKNIYVGSERALVSADADSVIFEVVPLLSGAVFASAVVGSIFDQYHRRFASAEMDAVRRLGDEGVLRTFRSATDPALLQYVGELIRGARYDITFIGMGLGLLAHNRELMTAIGEQLKKEPHLKVRIVMGDSNNAGVMNRVTEEQSWHSTSGFSYDPTWVSRYPDEIRSVLRAAVDQGSRSRLTISNSRDCPFLTVAKVDGVMLFFSYGPPSVRGSESPWIAIDASAHGPIPQFLHRTISHYTADRVASGEGDSGVHAGKTVRH